MPIPLFLLGAGFNINANSEFGNRDDDQRYPRISDCAKYFPPDIRAEIRSGKISIERAFEEKHEATSSTTASPMERLIERLMHADWQTGQWLLRTEGTNTYCEFLRFFASSHFLSYNYDCLIETLLFKFKKWVPEDGFEVDVQVDSDQVPGHVQPKIRSAQKIIHLHGSNMVYTNSCEITRPRIKGPFSLWLRGDATTRFAMATNGLFQGVLIIKSSVVVSRVQSFADWKLTICFHDEAGKETHCIFDPGDTASYLVDVFWAAKGEEAYLAACEGMDIYGYSFSRGRSIAPNTQVERGIIQQFSSGVEQDESVGYHRFEDFCRGMSRGLADALHKKYFMRLP